MAKRSKAKAGQVIIPMSREVKGSGGGARLAEGDYLATVKKVTKETSKEEGNPYLKWLFDVEGKSVADNTTLTDKSLWKLRQLLEAMGMKVPDTDFPLTLKKYKGKEVGVTLVDDEPYNGRIKSTVAEYMDPKVIGQDDVDDDDEDEDEDDNDLEEMDRAELKAFIKSEGLDVKIKKSMDEDDIRAAIEEAQEDDDEDEDDDEEEMEEFDLDDDL